MSFFKRPAWAQPQEVDDEEKEEGDIFRHSGRAYESIVAEQARRKKEAVEAKRVKEKARAGKSRGGKRRSEGDGEEGGKKRRVSGENDGDLLAGEDEEFRSTVNAGEDAVVSAVRRSPRKNKNGDQHVSNGSRANVVDLDASEDEMASTTKSTASSGLPNATQTAIPQEDEESDEELAELARQARARRLQRDTAHSASPGIAGTTSPSPALPPQQETDKPKLPTPQLPDPVVQLFVSSRIANTTPLLVFRKLSQRLQEIRVIWCQKQGFTQEFTKDVFFIHRMRRVYDATTCRSLGLEADADGNLTMKGAEGQEGVDKVHLEAVTDEIYSQLRAEKIREDLIRSGRLAQEEETEGEEGMEGAAAGPDQAAAEDGLIRLLLRAKGKAEFRLKVKPTTVFSKIMGACKKTFRLADDQSLFLEFDGERLESDEQVQNTEISDMDVIDVHVS